MDINQTLSELTSLPVPDRLRVVESLWDSIESDTPVSLSPEQLAELNRRIEAHEENPDELQATLAKMVRSQIGPIACYRETSIVARLPKTRSGKILRGTMRAISNGKEWRMPSTIDDPASLDEITESLKNMGYPKK